MKNSKKGFTLIELLAVIVILAILVAVAIPAITRYLNTARKGTYATNAQAAISAVRNDVISKGYTTNSIYTLDSIDALLDKKLENSPYGAPYQDSSYVKVEFDNATGNATYSICLTDGNNGFTETQEVNVGEDTVKTGQTVTCTAPTEGYAQR